MATTTNIAQRADPRLGTIALRFLVVALTVATAAIHASLGGLMFLANAAGYTALAVAMILPGPIGHIRWLVRIALIGFAAATIGGWVLFGTRFPLAYLDKAIEVALIGVVGLELWRSDGGPLGVARQARRLIGRFARATTTRVHR
jgi:hypothetical protein